MFIINIFKRTLLIILIIFALPLLFIIYILFGEKGASNYFKFVNNLDN